MGEPEYATTIHVAKQEKKEKTKSTTTECQLIAQLCRGLQSAVDLNGLEGKLLFFDKGRWQADGLN